MFFFCRCCCFVLLFLHLVKILKMLFFFFITWFVSKNVPKFVHCIKKLTTFFFIKGLPFLVFSLDDPYSRKNSSLSLVSSCWLSLSLPKLPMCDPSSPPPVCNSSAIFHCICVQDQGMQCKMKQQKWWISFCSNTPVVIAVHWYNAMIIQNKQDFTPESVGYRLVSLSDLQLTSCRLHTWFRT